MRQIIRDVWAAAGNAASVDEDIAAAVAAGIFTDAILDAVQAPADARKLVGMAMLGFTEARALAGLDDIADVFPITPITKEEARDLKKLDD